MNITSDQLAEARHYIELGRYKQSIDVLKSVISQNPTNGTAFYMMALCHYGLDSFSDAINNCRTSMENKFSEVACLTLMGQIYSKACNYRDSEKCYLEALHLQPESVPALSQYAILMLKTGNEEKAKELIEEAARIDPEDPIVVKGMFKFYMMKNKQSKLATLINLLNHSNIYSRHLNLGIHNMFENKLKEARENFREAFLLNPTDNKLLEILTKLDRECSLIYAPIRFIRKIQPAILWIIFVPSTFVLIKLKYYIPAIIWMGSYLLLAIYSWFAPLLYKIFNRNRF